MLDDWFWITDAIPLPKNTFQKYSVVLHHSRELGSTAPQSSAGRLYTPLAAPGCPILLAVLFYGDLTSCVCAVERLCQQWGHLKVVN